MQRLHAVGSFSAINNSLLLAHFNDTILEKYVFSSYHERGKMKNFWVPIKNRTSYLRIPHSDALPLSHRDPRWARSITKFIWHASCILLGSAMSIDSVENCFIQSSLYIKQFRNLLITNKWYKMENLPPFANLFHSTYLLGYQCCNIIIKTHYTYWTMRILSFCTENHSWKMKNTDMVLQYLKYRHNQSYSLEGSNISSFIKVLPVCMLVCKNILDAISLTNNYCNTTGTILEKYIYNTPTCGG